MNILDIFIVLPLLWFAYKGYSKGFIVGLFSLAALLLGIYAAIRFSGISEDYLTDELGVNGDYTHIIAFSLTFVAVVVVVNLLGRVFSKLADWVMLGWLNKVAGVAFGLLKAALVLSVLIYIINRVDPAGRLLTPELKAESRLYGPMQQLAMKVFPMLEEGMERVRGNGDERLLTD